MLDPTVRKVSFGLAWDCGSDVDSSLVLFNKVRGLWLTGVSASGATTSTTQELETPPPLRTLDTHPAHPTPQCLHLLVRQYRPHPSHCSHML